MFSVSFIGETVLKLYNINYSQNWIECSLQNISTADYFYDLNWSQFYTICANKCLFIGASQVHGVSKISCTQKGNIRSNPKVVISKGGNSHNIGNHTSVCRSKWMVFADTDTILLTRLRPLRPNSRDPWTKSLFLLTPTRSMIRKSSCKTRFFKKLYCKITLYDINLNLA